MGVPLSIGVSLGAALLLNSPFARAQAFFRTALFAPVVTTLVAVAIVWRYLFHTRYGSVNEGLAALGSLPSTGSAIRTGRCPPSSCSPSGRTSLHMVILLAALQAIPAELYESARIDGATTTQVRHVTLPSLGPVLSLVSILTMAGYFQLFAEPYVMTEGGPLRSTFSVLYFMFDQGFKWWNLGVASAIAFLLFALVLAASEALLRFARSRGDERPGWMVNGLLAALAFVSLFPLALDALGVLHARGGREHVAPASSRFRPARQLPRALPRVGMGRYFATASSWPRRSPWGPWRST